MKILMIGGKIFLGKHIVENLLKEGHEVTLFNRGKHNPQMFNDLETIIGDRETDLQLLNEKTWDIVIDTCGYIPRIVKVSTDFFKDKTKSYLFISTLSVYKDFSTENYDENYPLGKLDDETTEKLNGETYGPLKALCEKEVLNTFGDRALIVRPGLIVGPDDPTDRFSYWVKRIADGGEVLLPDNKNRNMQFIDVRDLSEWIVKLISEKKTGIFNATGPGEKINMKNFAELCSKNCNADYSYTFVSERFLLDNKVTPYMEIPLWVPDNKDYKGFDSANCSKAISSGLEFRSVEQTINDTYEWFQKLGKNKLNAGLSKEKEEELLRKWREKCLTK